MSIVWKAEIAHSRKRPQWAVFFFTEPKGSASTCFEFDGYGCNHPNNHAALNPSISLASFAVAGRRP